MIESILIVDDEPLICELISKLLADKGYQTHSVLDGKNMLSYLESNVPDLIILDFLLPDINGHKLCKEVRETSTVPILMITAHDSETNMVKSFEVGIDDFIAKPFNPKELELRVEAILRRSKATQEQLTHNAKKSSSITFGVWTFERNVDVLHHKDGKTIPLTEYEVKLLEIFCNNPNQVISREQIYKALESHSDMDSLQAINVYIYRLRNKIGKQHIQSIRYKGYKFVTSTK